MYFISNCHLDIVFEVRRWSRFDSFPESTDSFDFRIIHGHAWFPPRCAKLAIHSIERFRLFENVERKFLIHVVKLARCLCIVGLADAVAHRFCHFPCTFTNVHIAISSGSRALIEAEESHCDKTPSTA